MYDPMDPPAQGIPADPLPDDLPEGDSSEVVEDEDVVFELEHTVVEIEWGMPLSGDTDE